MPLFLIQYYDIPVTPNHRAHDTTSRDYLLDYPTAEPLAETLRAGYMGKGVARPRRRTRQISHWEPVWSSEYCLDRIMPHTRHQPGPSRRATPCGHGTHASQRYSDDGEDLYLRNAAPDRGRGVPAECPGGHTHKDQSQAVFWSHSEPRLPEMVNGQKCLEANARPEWDLRYFSNSTARLRSRNAVAVRMTQGLYFEV